VKIKSPKEYCRDNDYGRLDVINDNEGNPIDLNIQCDDNDNDEDEDGDEDENQGEIQDAGERSSNLHGIQK